MIKKKQKVFEVLMNNNIMKRKRMNKRGAFTDLFLFMIMAFVLLVVCGVMIYISMITNQKLHSELDKSGTGLSQNYSKVITATMGQVDVAYQSLYYLSLFIIVAMVISIFIGSYYVNTHPIFFVPYIFICIIATIVSVVISNAYQTITQEPSLASTFAGFIGSNYIMYYLPMWVIVVGVTGGIIMFIRMKQEEFMPYG